MKCKNCGAELNNGKCEYCGAFYPKYQRYVYIKGDPSKNDDSRMHNVIEVTCLGDSEPRFIEV